MLSQRLVFVSLVSCLFVLTPAGVLIEHHSTAHADDVLRSTSYGLDLAKVTLFVETNHEYHERFYNRVLARFSKNKLYINRNGPYAQDDPVLHIRVETIPIDEACPSKVLYYQNLELVEDVISDRTPRIRARAVTASYGVPERIVPHRLTIEQLESDLDSLVDGFIQDYSFANGKRK